MNHNLSGRGRTLAGVLATSALAIGGLAATGVPAEGVAQAAVPAGDCATAYPISDLAKDQPVTGKTVTSGTTPEGFTGTVLGVLDNGIAPGLDMVMMRLTSPEIDRVGIWQGMSGSPVYAADGRLIGAVAYGLAYGPSPVAGVTPFADMDDYLADTTTSARIEVGDKAARTIARHTDVTATQAAEGFRELPMPLSVSGISQRRLDADVEGHHPWLKQLQGARAGSAASSDAGTADDIVAGGNLAAALSYGDVTMAGVGTATSVCDGRVVGFGHPMNFLGKTTLGLAPADTIYIQEDSLGPGFKVANIGLPAGTITDDHLTGITGTFGQMPPDIRVTDTASYADRSRTGTSHALVQTSLADVYFNQFVGNTDRVIDGVHAGSADLTYTATGTDAAGQPFSIDFSDLYQSSYDINYDSVFETADATYALSQMPGVTVSDVSADLTVTDDSTSWKVAGMAVKKGGEFVKLSRRSRLKVHPGQRLALQALLKGATGSRTVPLSVRVPRHPKSRFGDLQVVGGGWLYNDGVYRSTTPQELADALGASPRNDQVEAVLSLYLRRKTSTTRADSAPLGVVVNGQRMVAVKVVG